MKDMIIQEAIKNVKLYGFRGFTMDDLAASLGMSKKTLYKYFSSKKELISELVQKTLDLEMEMAQLEVNKHTNWNTKLTALLSIYSYTDIPYRLIDEIYRFFPKEREKIKELASYRKQMILGLLKEGIAKGEIREDIDPAALVLVLHKLFMTPTEEKFLIENQLTVNSLMNQMKSLFFDGILTDKKADK